MPADSCSGIPFSNSARPSSCPGLLLWPMLSELSGVGRPADSACTPPTCRRARAVRYEQDPLRVVARRRRARAAAGALILYGEIRQQLAQRAATVESGPPMSQRG